LAALAPDSSRPRIIQPHTAHRAADRAEAATSDVICLTQAACRSSGVLVRARRDGRKLVARNGLCAQDAQRCAPDRVRTRDENVEVSTHDVA
jgi:hypothetical protein